MHSINEFKKSLFINAFTSGFYSMYMKQVTSRHHQILYLLNMILDSWLNLSFCCCCCCIFILRILHLLLKKTTEMRRWMYLQEVCPGKTKSVQGRGGGQIQKEIWFGITFSFVITEAFDCMPREIDSKSQTRVLCVCDSQVIPLSTIHFALINFKLFAQFIKVINLFFKRYVQNSWPCNCYI